MENNNFFNNDEINLLTNLLVYNIEQLVKKHHDISFSVLDETIKKQLQQQVDLDVKKQQDLLNKLLRFS